MTDTYTINRTDSTLVLTLPTYTSDGPFGGASTTDLMLYGKFAPTYGEGYNENFYRLLETFACEEKGASPGTPQDSGDLGAGYGINNPVVGQLWFNKTTEFVYVYNGADWLQVGTDASIIFDVGTTLERPASAPEGTPYYDTTLDGLLVYVAGQWTPTDLRLGGTIEGTLTIDPPSACQEALILDSSPVTGMTFVNASNGAYPYVRVLNSTGDVLHIVKDSADGGLCSGTSVSVFQILQTGEAIYSGGGGSPSSGDIRLPNATITLDDHVVTKLYVDDAIASIPTGGGLGLGSPPTTLDIELNDTCDDPIIVRGTTVTGISFNAASRAGSRYLRLKTDTSNYLIVEKDNVDDGLCSGTAANILNIATTGEMIFLGTGSGPNNGDIRIPNAVVSETTHVTPKWWVTSYVDNVFSGAAQGPTVTYEKHTATSAQATFNLGITYHPTTAGDRLQMFVNGHKQSKNIFYTEPNDHQVDIIAPSPLIAGDIVEFYAFNDKAPDLVRLSDLIDVGISVGSLSPSITPSDGDMLIYSSGTNMWEATSNFQIIIDQIVGPDVTEGVTQPSVFVRGNTFSVTVLNGTPLTAVGIQTASQIGTPTDGITTDWYFLGTTDSSGNLSITAPLSVFGLDIPPEGGMGSPVGSPTPVGSPLTYTTWLRIGIGMTGVGGGFTPPTTRYGWIPVIWEYRNAISGVVSWNEFYV